MGGPPLADRRPGSRIHGYELPVCGGSPALFLSPKATLAPTSPRSERPSAAPDAAAPSAPPNPLAGNGFGAMGLSPIMLKSLERANYLDPTPIQAGLIPRALAGVDVMGQAQTGTGKTAAFAIPILEQIKPHPQGRAAAGPGPGAHPRIGRPGPRRVHQAGRGRDTPRRGRLRRQADPQTDRAT